ncbi:MAG: hypothetical protein R2706_06355 [Acidimicrobiales bacterium]
MDAATKTDVSTIRSADVELIWHVETSWIALGRAEQHGDLVADAELLAGNNDAVLENPALKHL